MFLGLPLKREYFLASQCSLKNKNLYIFCNKTNYIFRDINKKTKKL